MADPDWTDPCAIATWLKPQLYKVAAGSSVVTVRHGENQTSFSQANYDALTALYLEAVSDCAKKTGNKLGRRRAFTAR
jgi:hypothetical protein